MQPLHLFFYRWLLANRAQRQRPSGFTLLELLISLVIASLVMGGLLFIVVQLTTMDKREANLDQVQRDMNRAMAFIADDLQEAVYVYPGTATAADDGRPNNGLSEIAAQLAPDPNFPKASDEVPILAFWRIDPIKDGFPACASTTTTPAQKVIKQQCDALRIRQAAYTLVVYVQKNNNGGSNWPGQSRIIRYELPKYADSIPTDLTTRAGYRDPTNSTDPKASFEKWERDGTPAGSQNVLVDYVQAPKLSPAVALTRAPLSDTGGACRSYGVVGGNPLYSVVPSDATVTTNNTFFGCVRNPDIGGVIGTRGGQDVYVFLRGNVQSVKGGVRGYSNETSLPILETQVMVKGVVNKGFNQ